MTVSAAKSPKRKTKQTVVPKGRRTNEERSSQTRSACVAAAIRVLHTRGYGGFRVEEVARIAKVSRGAQTHHFPTKESLALAAVEEIFRTSEDATRARVAALTVQSDLVEALIEDGIEFFLSPGFAVSLDLLSVGQQTGPFRRAVLASARAHRHAAEELWVNVLTERVFTAEQARDALWLAFTVARGMAVRRFIDRAPEEERHGLERLRRLVAEILTVRRSS